MSIILLDLNGTIAVDGKIKEGVKDRLNKLKNKAKIFILSADTYGTLNNILNDLNVEGIRINKENHEKESLAKLKILKELKKKFPNEKIIAIGNGSNDELMLKYSDLGICVINEEGASVKAILSADVVVKDINDALDLILKENRLKATLRN
ncbi:haloacid dehalogenase [Methanocaldococcus villosus KIN24-T80]|uniref:Haloacid dehalogenase n=1 Tax=Methanocaldococcus villosus KIN24-T80 TaxID=1069083 RepID=N6VWW3_9EURY|nr:HAD hydrolase family protein [Methanocaldococcus villosus]ENN95582.1 haloacid dehalogenase [Methanocaldococcus villosus KIN24-T80]